MSCVCVCVCVCVLLPHIQSPSRMDLSEICDNVKTGREYALLGNYDSSMVYYQGVIQQIRKYCQALRDPALKLKWQQVGPLVTHTRSHTLLSVKTVKHLEEDLMGHKFAIFFTDRTELAASLFN